MTTFRTEYKQGVALLFTIIFLFFTWGCRTYKPAQMHPVSSIDAVQFYIVDANFPLDFAWRIDPEVLRHDGVAGKISPLTKEEAVFISRGQFQKVDVNRRIRVVVLYVANAYAQTLFNTTDIDLSFNQALRSEVYDFNRHKSPVWVLVGVTAPLAIMSVAALIACSCPYVYAENPDGSAYEGDIFAGATHPQLERNDWLPLTRLKPDGDEYRLRIANKDPEIQHINLLELVAVDHAPGMQVLYDKYGRLHTLSQPAPPVQATDLQGQDVQEFILREDDILWRGNLDNADARAEDGLILHFRRPPGVREAHLVIRANSSPWLAYSHESLQREMGKYGPLVRERFLNKDSAALQQWALQQNIPLSVYLKTASGEWQFIDFFHLIGPESPRRDMLTLDLSNAPGDQVAIKLATGFLFWQIDYAGLDFSTDQTLQPRVLPVLGAVDQHGQDRKPALLADDEQYYIQAMNGDEAILRFPAPGVPAGLERSLFLHAKGNYRILRDPAPGNPPKRFLRQFQYPDAFPRYSREQWNLFTQQDTIWSAGMPN